MGRDAKPEQLHVREHQKSHRSHRRCRDAGTFAYWLLLLRNYHILAAVGAGVALGVAAMARTKHTGWGLLTGVLAVFACVLVESLFRPFAVDPSFSYFISHLHDLPGYSLVSLAVVAVLGVYFGRGRARVDSD